MAKSAKTLRTETSSHIAMTIKTANTGKKQQKVSRLLIRSREKLKFRQRSTIYVNFLTAPKLPKISDCQRSQKLYIHQKYGYNKTTNLAVSGEFPDLSNILILPHMYQSIKLPNRKSNVGWSSGRYWIQTTDFCCWSTLLKVFDERYCFYVTFEENFYLGKRRFSDGGLWLIVRTFLVKKA